MSDKSTDDRGPPVWRVLVCKDGRRYALQAASGKRRAASSYKALERTGYRDAYNASIHLADSHTEEEAIKAFDKAVKDGAQHVCVYQYGFANRGFRPAEYKDPFTLRPDHGVLPERYTNLT